jgi:hypothetical protein
MPLRAIHREQSGDERQRSYLRILDQKLADILVRIEQDVRLFPSIAIGNGGSAMTGDDLPNLPFYGRTVASFLKYAMRCTWVCPWTLAGWCRMKMGL